MTAWQRRDFLVPVELEEVVTAGLWAAGMAGCEVRPAGEEAVRVEAYFARDVPEVDVAAWPGVVAAGGGAVEERDWLAEYRAAARPLDVGPFRVDPRDAGLAGDEPPPGRIPLRIPAESAFGTGSHETTRLLLAWLGELDLAGRTVLDVGTGSGILALAALARGARRADAFDLDSGAVLVARRNARHNRLAPRLFAGRLAALSTAARYDLVLVNVLPERIADDLPRLASTLAPGGVLLSSGNLLDRRDEWIARWADAGLRSEEERVDGEWIALRLRRRA